MSIKSTLKAALNTLEVHSPTILTALGCVGVVATGCLAGRAGFKVKQVLDENNADEMDKEEFRDLVVHEVLPEVIAPVVMGGASIAAIVGAHKKSAARIAVLAGAYSMKDKTLADYKEKMKELLGDKKAKEVQAAVAEKQVQNDSTPKELIYQTGHGDTLCKDLVFGTKFYCDIEHIRHAVNNINYQVSHGDQPTVNDFYYEIGLPPIKAGNGFGWTMHCDYAAQQMLDVDYSAALDTDDTPVITIEYNINPFRSWWNDYIDD